MHNNNHLKSMWLMMIPCVLLVIVLLFRSGSSVNWTSIILLGVCVGGHFLMMRGMYTQDEHSNHTRDDVGTDDTDKNSCCEKH